MKVIIIGAGMTGPVVAMLLKQKGFEPVIYERHADISPEGLSMQLTGQVWKVLNILGLAEEAIALTREMEWLYCVSSATGRVFIDAPVYADIQKSSGWPVRATFRNTLPKFILKNTEKCGIPIHWGRKFVDLKQDGETVTAFFEDGTTDTGNLLIGCDGVHSKVRDSLFGKAEVFYTGVRIVGGSTPYSEALPPPSPRRAFHVAGEGVHFITLPTADGKFAWAISDTGGGDVKDDWKTASTETVEEVLASVPFERLGREASAIVKGCTDAIRFRLHLRPIAPVWHKGRVVLLGDAAHPSAPFLGQGANQSFEDIYHLVRCLLQHQPLTNESIDQAFTSYTALRLPRVRRTSEQTKIEGDERIVEGREALLAREEEQAKGLESNTWKVILEMVQGPYQERARSR